MEFSEINGCNRLGRDLGGLFEFNTVTRYMILFAMCSSIYFLYRCRLCKIYKVTHDCMPYTKIAHLRGTDIATGMSHDNWDRNTAFGAWTLSNSSLHKFTYVGFKCVNIFGKKKFN